MKRFMSLFLATLIAIFCFMSAFALPLLAKSNTVSEDTTKTDADSIPTVPNTNAACVYNIENKAYIFKKNSDKQIYPASTVKLMTAILAVEALGGQLDKQITVTSEELAGVQGNNIALKRDEVLTVQDLLYALICGCANDAANVLAVEVAGSIDQFVVMMNNKARELGAINTNYTNPTGIHNPAMVTTAADTAKVAAYACEFELITDISSAEKYIIEPTNKQPRRTIFNKNYYFSTYVEYKYIWSVPRGLNAGYTTEGGYCMVTSAARDGLTYVVVVMGARADDKTIYSYTEAADLLKWSLVSYGYKKVLTTSDMICEMPVKLASKVDYVTLFPSEDIELFLPKNIDVTKDLKMTWQLNVDSFTAPVSEGQIGGWLTVTYNDESLGTYDLVTRNSVSRNNILYVLDLIKGLTGMPQFKTVVIILIIFAVGYVVFLFYISLPKRRRRR